MIEVDFMIYLANKISAAVFVPVNLIIELLSTMPSSAFPLPLFPHPCPNVALHFPFQMPAGLDYPA